MLHPSPPPYLNRMLPDLEDTKNNLKINESLIEV